MSDTVDLRFLAELASQNLAELRELKTELGEVRRLTLLVSEHTHRLDRRIGELLDDLELMIKSELMGRQAHFETRLEAPIGDVVARPEALEHRPA